MWPSICSNSKLDFPSPKDALCQVWLNLTNDTGEKNFKFCQMYFSPFRYYLHLETGVTLHLNKLEFPSPKDDLKMKK